jgi:flagellar biosynthesis/type III secretory pathway protein FliH
VTLTLARLVPAESADGAVPVSVPGRSDTLPASIVPASVVDAHEQARSIVAAAEVRARELVSGAEAELERLKAEARRQGRELALAELSARALALSRAEAALDERALGRSTELSRLLAERLLGEALQLEPARVVSLARAALAEARGARSVTIVAHPDDLPELERALHQGELERVTRLVPNAERGRGSLRLETEIGVLDAELSVQLDRLVAALRAAPP